MRFIVFTFLVLLASCGSENQAANAENTPVTSNIKTTQVSPPNLTNADASNLKYKKTASTFSEFAVFTTISANEENIEYFFKTLEGVRVIFKVSQDGEPEVIVPENLLENAKYQEGFPGANGEMAGRVFELIYDKDNVIAEVKLAVTE